MFATVNFTDPVGRVLYGFYSSEPKKICSIRHADGWKFLACDGKFSLPYTYKACVESTNYSCCENRSWQWNSSNWGKNIYVSISISQPDQSACKTEIIKCFEINQPLVRPERFTIGTQNLCGSRKFPNPPQAKLLEISRWRVFKTRKFLRRSIKLNCISWMFGEGGFRNHKNYCGRGLDILWNKGKWHIIRNFKRKAAIKCAMPSIMAIAMTTCHRLEAP